MTTVRIFPSAGGPAPIECAGCGCFGAAPWASVVDDAGNPLCCGCAQRSNHSLYACAEYATGLRDALAALPQDERPAVLRVLATIIAEAL
ncbi:hypothetical protein ABT040_30195 [Streptomyces sp. NPDC002688]|uniref:hypothetical protein n=1 Tax=Streptomyces sp. NPDC002688 TaxID=3154423 RepID=UPI00331CAE1F